MKKLLIRSFIGIIILFGIGFVYLDQSDFFLIDTCLDNGGSWHYGNRSCSHAMNYKGLR